MNKPLPLETFDSRDAAVMKAWTEYASVAKWEGRAVVVRPVDEARTAWGIYLGPTEDEADSR